MSSEGTQTKPEPFRIRLHPENDNFKSFNTVADLKDYIAKEYQFWRSHLIQGSPFVEKFKRFQDQILQVEQQTSDSQISTRISQVVTSFNNDPQLVYSETALGSFLGTLHSQDRDRAAGAFAYLRS
jgi:uncharacterized membrane-anchored protein YhcB (DUF1043 family)